jgi:hypothetical protein
VKILATAVFEHVVYDLRLIDRSGPDHLHLVVDALLRPGDADAGPLLVPVPQLLALVGDEVAGPLLRRLRDEGRLRSHDGVQHVAFPMWSPAPPDQRWGPGS